MSDEEPVSPLDRCAALRFPEFADGTPAGDKIRALEDYLTLTAIVEAECHELRLTAQRELKDAGAAWDGIQGWESLLARPSRAKDATAAEVTEAKTKVRPDLAATMKEATWLVARCNEAIRRTEWEGKRVSRLYTFLTGS